ncbi:hypothetical protein ABEP42_29410 [Priestia megaterium]|uniref:hypothetical protein n=1 Tax=Priestia megaterium TaxID=1404 RepID=UPI000EB6C394|nr:hypothetical protein [Priestia megaterium]
MSLIPGFIGDKGLLNHQNTLLIAAFGILYLLDFILIEKSNGITVVQGPLVCPIGTIAVDDGKCDIFEELSEKEVASLNIDNMKDGSIVKKRRGLDVIVVAKDVSMSYLTIDKIDRFPMNYKVVPYGSNCRNEKITTAVRLKNALFVHILKPKSSYYC